MELILENEEEYPIRAGYYECKDRGHKSYLSVRYIMDNKIVFLEIWLDHQNYKIERRNNQINYKVKEFNSFKFIDLQFNGDYIIKTRAGKKKEYHLKSLWPISYDISRHRNPSEFQAIYNDIKDNGVAVINDLFIDQLDLLQTLFDRFYIENRKPTNRGWWANHMSGNIQTSLYIDELINPKIIPYLDYLLGENNWSCGHRLQVCFETKPDILRCPNYHVDQMLWTFSEPFVLLIGIPLKGEFDKDLGGNFAFFEKSHERLRDQVKATNEQLLSSNEHKSKKIFEIGELKYRKASILKAGVGSIFFSHYRTIHAAMYNFGSIRSIAYIRVEVKEELRSKLNIRIIDKWSDSIKEYHHMDLFLKRE